MTFTVTYRGADGAPVSETVEAAWMLAHPSGSAYAESSLRKHSLSSAHLPGFAITSGLI